MQQQRHRLMQHQIANGQHIQYQQQQQPQQQIADSRRGANEPIYQSYYSQPQQYQQQQTQQQLLLSQQHQAQKQQQTEFYEDPSLHYDFSYDRSGVTGDEEDWNRDRDRSQSQDNSSSAYGRGPSSSRDGSWHEGGWKGLQRALYQCVACCIKCVGPV